VAGAGHLNIALVNVVLMAAAMIGDSTGYWLGRTTGPRIFNRPDSLFFKQEYITRTNAFYAKYGGKTLVFARFVPIVRTFAAFVAGVGQMPYRRFLPYSIGGGIGWVFSMTMLGYSLGSIPIVRRNFEKVILTIVFVSLLPTVIEVIRARWPSQRAAHKTSGK
jgi:membrane-associated protein